VDNAAGASHPDRPRSQIAWPRSQSEASCQAILHRRRNQSAVSLKICLHVLMQLRHEAPPFESPQEGIDAMSLFRKIQTAPSGPLGAALDRVEYVVRPHNDSWLIEHAGGKYGPYKSHREAMLFAIDAARKLGALGKNTGVKMIDRCGHLLTTWNYGAGRRPSVF
jgi:hypothetical protein